MADKNNTIKTTAELDTSQAEQSLKKLGNEGSKSMDGIAKSADALSESSQKAAKSTSDLGDASSKSKKGMEALDQASGGLLTSFKALATNPIGIVLAALVGIFATLKEAVSRSGEASEIFGKIGSKLSGVMNGLLAVLEPVVIFIGEKLLQAIESPGQAIKDLGNFIKENLINRVKSFLVLGEAFTLLLEGEFAAAAKKGADAVIQLGTGVANATDKIVDFGEKAAKSYNDAAEASERLANAEKTLARNRIALEKEQLKSLRAAEEERQIRDDVSKSISERIEANKRLGKILDDQSKRELAIAQQDLNIAKSKQAATGDTIENIEAVGDAEIKLLEIQERITGQRSEQLVNEQGLLKEREDKITELALKEQEIQNSLSELKIRSIQEEGDKKLAAELEFLEKKKQQELDNLELTESGKKEIEERFKLEKAELEAAENERKAAEELAKKESLLELEEIELERLREKDQLTLERELEFLEKKRLQDVSAANLTAEEIDIINARSADQKRKVEEAEIAAAKAKDAAVLNSALDGAAEAFGIAQEVAVARMIMEAPQAIAGSFKNAAASYAPPLAQVMGALGAATTVVPIIKGLADIKKARFPGKKKGGSGGGGSISAPPSGGGGVSVDAISDIAANNSARLGIDPSLGSSASADASNNVLGGATNNIVFSEAKYQDFQSQVSFKESKSTV